MMVRDNRTTDSVAVWPRTSADCLLMSSTI